MDKLFGCALSVSLVAAQHVGKQKVEEHLPMSHEYCSESVGGCLREDTNIVLDQNWRWVHNVNGYTNCFDNDKWIPSFCPDPLTCSQNCALDGVDQQTWAGTYGVNSFGTGIQQKFIEPGGNVGTRVYLMEDEDTYKIFHMKNKEFSFEVELSTLPCGINAALYFVEMEADGGLASSGGLNTAGAKYGTGYCDAQCPNDIKFVGGKGNVDNAMRVCCAEMDIWESNSISTAVTPHPCSIDKGSKLCDGDTCYCDSDGCDFNSYREGVKDFYGPGSNYTVDSTKPITVVTQFLTSDGTDIGDLSEIRRFYVQDGKKIPNSESTLGSDSLTDEVCKNQKELFGEENKFAARGGMKSLGDAMDRGMVLTMSIWDDTAAHMLWLDSTYPTDATGPGAERGPCSVDSGVPADVRRDNPNAFVRWSNVKYGDIGATYPGLPPAPAPPTPPTPVPQCSDGTFLGEACGYNCDANCNCGRCNSKPGCMSADKCLDPTGCNAGGNARWCGSFTPSPPGPPAPTPPPPPPPQCAQRDGTYTGPACGYACDSNCNCGHCNTKPGCMSEDQCLGPCNSGNNAKWCPGGANNVTLV